MKQKRISAKTMARQKRLAEALKRNLQRRKDRPDTRASGRDPDKPPETKSR
jgi:hypothetical protein